MANPTPFEPGFDYSDFEASNPTRPKPGNQLDNDFANLQRTTGETIDALSDIRRSDGALNNGLVGPDQLSPALTIGFKPRGAWTAGETYNAGDGVTYGSVFYSARSTHLATDENRPDVDPDTWLFLYNMVDVTIPDYSLVNEKFADESVDLRVLAPEARPEALAQRLADRTDAAEGAGLVGVDPGLTYPVGSVGYQIEDAGMWAKRPGIMATRYFISAMRDDAYYSVAYSGSAADRYYHSPRVVRDAGGRLHLAASKSLFHGFANSTPADPVDPQGVAVYRFSDDEGRTWSPEQVICVALPRDDPGLPRTVFDIHIGVCPSGRLVAVVSDIPPPSAQWAVPTGQTKYRWLVCDTRGELNDDDTTAWVDKGVFFTADNDYARIYCERIKPVPLPSGGYRMAFTDYRKTTAGGNNIVRSFWTSDDEFETAPTIRSNIANLQNSANETDFCFADPYLGWAIARSGGEMHVTRDGGDSWTLIGNSTNYTRQLWETGGLVAPVMDVVWSYGKPFVVLGYSHRGAGPDGPRWLVAPVTNLLNFESAVALGQQFTPWGNNEYSGPTVSGPGGYNSAIYYPEGGFLYADCTEVGASPVTGYTMADVRVVVTSAKPWFPVPGGLMIGSATSTLNQYNVNEVPFIPRLEGSTGAGTPTYSSAVGYNVRIGRVAFVDAEMIVTAYTGITGTLLIRGLPFAPLVVGFNPASIRIEVVGALAVGFTDSDRIIGLLLPSTNQIALYKKANSGGLVSLATTDLGAAFNVRISGHYYCANNGLT